MRKIIASLLTLGLLLSALPALAETTTTPTRKPAGIVKQIQKQNKILLEKTRNAAIAKANADHKAALKAAEAAYKVAVNKAKADRKAAIEAANAALKAAKAASPTIVPPIVTSTPTSTP